MNEESVSNPLLDADVNEISDPTIKEICQFVLKEAQNAFDRGEIDPAEFVSRHLGINITRLTRRHSE
jgi:hypothetical protein